MLGSSMALSFKNVVVTRGNVLETLWRIVRRTFILFALGLLVNSNYDMSHARIPGVLQRFAISYFVVALIMVFVPKIKRGGAPQTAEVNHFF